MSLIRESVVEEILANPAKSQLANSLRAELSQAIEYGHLALPDEMRALRDGLPLNREAVEKVLNAVKIFAKNRGCMPSHKGLRPYYYDDLSNLNREQAWWGFEFECGFSSSQARADAIEYAWEVADGVTFDGEGEGDWRSEVTFLPAEESKFDDGTAPAYKFMQWCSDHPDSMYRGANQMIGTHLNLSHPGLDNNNVYPVVYALNNSVHHLPFEMEGENVREAMFGRSRIYAGAFSRSGGNKRWIEMKLFRTTYNMEQFKTYIKTAKALTRCVEALLADGATGSENRKYIANLYEVWKDGVEPIVAQSDGYRGDSSGEWISQPPRNRTQPAIPRIRDEDEDEDYDEPFQADDDDGDEDY